MRSSGERVEVPAVAVGYALRHRRRLEAADVRPRDRVEQVHLALEGFALVPVRPDDGPRTADEHEPAVGGERSGTE